MSKTCWACGEDIEGGYRLFYPPKHRTSRGTYFGRRRRPDYLCGACSDLFNENGVEHPELVSLARLKDGPPPRLGIDIVPEGEGDGE